MHHELYLNELIIHALLSFLLGKILWLFTEPNVCTYILRKYIIALVNWKNLGRL
jgi:hypothetical protein